MNRTVGLIDDLRDNTDILSTLLNDLCGVAEVRSFNSGKDFLEDLRRRDFSLVLLDLLMPEMDGYEVFRRIRQVDPVVPIVALTAYSAERSRAISLGFTDFVAKPVLDVESFCKLVRRYLDHPSSEKIA
jgi:CheY-like chemotaxis protein